MVGPGRSSACELSVINETMSGRLRQNTSGRLKFSTECGSSGEIPCCRVVKETRGAAEFAIRNYVAPHKHVRARLLQEFSCRGCVQHLSADRGRYGDLSVKSKYPKSFCFQAGHGQDSRIRDCRLLRDGRQQLRNPFPDQRWIAISRGKTLRGVSFNLSRKRGQSSKPPMLSLMRSNKPTVFFPTPLVQMIRLVSQLVKTIPNRSLSSETGYEPSSIHGSLFRPANPIFLGHDGQPQCSSDPNRIFDWLSCPGREAQLHA